MTEVIKTIKACHIRDGMRIRFNQGAYTLEGDVKSVEDYGGSLVDVTFERDGNEASIIITRNADVDVLRKPVPKEPENLGAVIKRTNSRGEITYLVRTGVRGEIGYPWVRAGVGYDYPWYVLAGGDCTIEVLSEGVKIDD